MPSEEIIIQISHPELIVLLCFLSIILVLALYVSIKAPIVFGDEGYHARVSQLIAKNEEIFIWQPVENTKLTKASYSRPPLWNLLQASFWYVFNDEIAIKILPPLIAFLTSIATYLLVKRLFDAKVGFVSGIIMMTIPSFVTYSVLSYTDVLLTFFMTLSVLLFILSSKEKSKKYLILSGIFGGFAYLTKAPGTAVYLFAFLAFFYELIIKRNFLQSFKKYAFLVVIFFLVNAGFFVRNYKYFNTPSCYNLPKPFDILNTTSCGISLYQPKNQFGGRVAQAGTEQNVFSMGLMNYLDFAYGNRWFVIFGFVSGILILLFKRNESIDMLLLFFFLLLALFPSIVGRAEDTARYTLCWSFLFAIVSGIFFAELYNFLKNLLGSVFKLEAVALILFAIIMIVSFVNAKEKLDIMFKVKQFSPAFFEACEWVKRNLPEDAKLYTVWSHRAIYACQRDGIYTTAVPDIALSRDVNFTVKVAKDIGATHIFVQKFSIDPRNNRYSENYDADFVQFLENNPEHFKVVYENGPNLNLTNRNVMNYVTLCIQQTGYLCDGNIIYEIIG